MTDNKSKPYHLPVMTGEVIKLLITDREGAYFDLTAGLGGHLKELATALKPTARLYGVDIDPEAVKLARENLAGIEQVKGIYNVSYTDLEAAMDLVAETSFDGILIDLGLSSYQLEHPERGFSYRFEGPLDMRFAPASQTRTAAFLVNNLEEKKLAEIFKVFGEERFARRIAKAIVKEREKNVIRTTIQLTDIIAEVVPPPYQTKTLSRIFQALRIAVNRELEQIHDVLPQTLELLKPGGRLAVISYHSLEDRIVKHFFRQEAKGCICPPEFPQCTCGHVPHLHIITKKAVTPSLQERKQNPRARSAKLRVAEKIDHEEDHA